MRTRVILGAGVVVAGAAAVALLRRSPGPGPDRSGMPGGLLNSPGAPRVSGRRPIGVQSEARLLPPRREPAPLSALARWEPAAPRSPVARTAAYLWAAPLTLLGVLVGLTAGVRPTVREGVLVFEGVGGPPGFVLAQFGYTAGALGHVVVARELGPRTFAHELVHVRQAERFGPLLGPLYLGLLAVYGYARHPLERAARRAGRRATEAAGEAERPA